MAFRDLRQFLAALEQTEELIRIKENVSPIFEMTAILRELDRVDGPAALFEQVEGTSMPVAGNLMGLRKRLARAFEIDEHAVVGYYLNKMEAPPVQPLVIDHAPVHDVVTSDSIDLFKMIPNVIYHQKDAGPYIAAGVVFSQDTQSGLRSMGIHRMHIRGKNRLGLNIFGGRLERNFFNAEARNEPLDIAIAIGLDPVITFASVLTVPTTDKVGIAGAFRGKPVELTRCVTVNAEVPAHAELILEGKILPGVREFEGPFGDTSGHYSDMPQGYVIEISGITHRSNPIYQVTVTGTNDVLGLVEVVWAGEAHKFLKGFIPGVQAVHLMAGSALQTVVVSMKKDNETDARRAAVKALMHNPHFKTRC